jgi:hypothetical protein
MIILGLGLGVPIGLLAVFFYLKNGHSLYELSDNDVKSFYRKQRMEYLGETREEINKSFDKFHSGKSVGEYRPLTDKLVVLTISSILGYVCYEFGYNQENFWIFAVIGIIGWIFAGFGLLDDGWERMQGFTVNYPLKHYSVQIPELEERGKKFKRESRRRTLRVFVFFILMFILVMVLIGQIDSSTGP